MRAFSLLKRYGIKGFAIKAEEKLKTKVILWNIIIPIFLGAIIYYLISPEVIFVKRMDFLIGKGIHISDITAVNPAIRIMRN